jgi:hypothetical protein
MFSKKHLHLTILTVLLLFTHIHSYEKCIHDTKDQPEPEIMDPETDNLDSQGRILAGTDLPGLRVKAYFGAMTADSAFNPYVQNQLIPPIVDYFGAALKVKFNLGALFKMGVGSVCGIETPAELQAGVVADIYWIIRDANDPNNWLADSYACNLMKDSKRPYIGKTTINKYQFTTTTDTLMHEKNIVCIMHEFIHILGFSKSLYGVFLDANGVWMQNTQSTAVLSGYNSTVLNIEPLTSKLRAHFGCASLKGAYMENTGGSGTAGSHFERRHFANDIMTSGLIYEMAMSEFTLALLDSTGWYVANYTYGEVLTFGQGQGCNFLTDDCSAAKYSEWCEGTVRGCTTAGLSGGACAADYRSDDCRFQHPRASYHCENPAAVSNARFKDLEVFGRGSGSKCFEGTLSPSTATTATATSFCLKFTCSSAGTSSMMGAPTGYKLTLSLGTTSIACTMAGPVSVPGYKGTMNCPDPLEYCTTVGKKSCPRNCMGRGTCINGVCKCNTGFKGTDCAGL